MVYFWGGVWDIVEFFPCNMHSMLYLVLIQAALEYLLDLILTGSICNPHSKGDAQNFDGVSALPRLSI